MDEDALRALVREAVERHLRGGSAPTRPASAAMIGSHASHVILPVESGEATADGMCLIEPAVRCSHCGYCQSYGH